MSRFNTDERAYNLVHGWDKRRMSDVSMSVLQETLADEMRQAVWDNYTTYNQTLIANEEAKNQQRAEILKAQGFNPFAPFVQTIDKAFTGARFINTSALRENQYKAAAMKDPGGILGRSFRSTESQFAGTLELSHAMPVEIQEMSKSFFDALANATGSTGSLNSWGQGVAGTTLLGRMAAGTYDYFVGGEGYMRGMEPGTPLYKEVMRHDPNWTPELKEAFADAIINSETKDIYEAAGITKEFLAGSQSLGAAYAAVIDRVTSYNAGHYWAQSSTFEKGTFFLGNLGRTIIADPDTAAELGIALAATAVTGGGSAAAWIGARGAALTTARGVRAANGLRAMVAASRPVQDFARAARPVFRGLEVGGRAVSKVGVVGANLNPFQMTENIILPAIRDVRALRAMVAAGQTSRTALRENVQFFRQLGKLSNAGVTGRIIANTFGDSTQIKFVQGLAANMADGALGNLGAYAFSRDEEYEWAKFLYGNQETWENYRFSMFGHPDHGGFLHSGVGSTLMGAGFGLIIGGAIRGLGVARHGMASKVAESGDVPPIVRSPWQSIKQAISNYDRNVTGGNPNSQLYKLVGADPGKTIDMGAEQLQRAFMADGVSEKKARVQARALASTAYHTGVEMSTLIRNVIRKDGTADLNAVARYIEGAGLTPAQRKARARRQRQRALHGADKDRRIVDKAMTLFNAKRIEKILEEGGDFDTASHAKILNELIDSMSDANPIRKVLERYRNSIEMEKGELVSSLTNVMHTLSDEAIPDHVRQSAVDQVLIDAGLLSPDKKRGLKVTVADIRKGLTAEKVAEAKAKADADLTAKMDADRAALEARIAELEKARDEEGSKLGIAPERPRDTEGLEAKPELTPEETKAAEDAYTKSAEDLQATFDELARLDAAERPIVSEEAAGRAALRDLVDEAVGKDVIEERMKGQMEASNVYYSDAVRMETTGLLPHERAVATARNTEAIVHRAILDLSKADDWDARAESVLYSLKDMAEATKRNREAFEAALGKLVAEDSGLAINIKDMRVAAADAAEKAVTAAHAEAKASAKKLKKRVGKEPRLEDYKAALKKDFGLDVDADTRGAKVLKGFGKGDNAKEALTNLYVDMHMLRQIGELSAEVRAKLADKVRKGDVTGFDPMLLAGAGDAATARNILGRHAAAIHRLHDVADSEGNVHISDVIAHFPEGHEHLIYNVYRDAETRNNYFNVDTMRAVNQERVARTDDALRQAFAEGVQRRKDTMGEKEFDAWARLHGLESEARATQNFLAGRGDAVASLASHHEEIIGRRMDQMYNGNRDMGRYLADQETEFGKGIFEAWRALPASVKEGLARQLARHGIDRWAGAKSIWEEGAFDELGSAEYAAFGRAMWEAIKNETMTPEEIKLYGDISAQWSGERNSATGYNVGRGLIESYARHTETDAHVDPVGGHHPLSMEAHKARMDSKAPPRIGFLGRLKNDNFIRLYKQFYSEQVRRYVEDMGDIRDGGVRMMSDDMIDDVIRYYENTAAMIKGATGPLPPEILARISPVRYNAAENFGLAPADIIDNILGELKSVRQRYNDRVAMVMDMPPAVMATLHDEFKMMEGAWSGMFGIGTIPGAKRDLSPLVSGDAGFGGGAFTPGSAMHFITLRSGQKWATADGLADAASNYGMTQLAALFKDKTPIEALRLFDEFDNARDASAQATTIGQAVARDYAAKYGDEETKIFLADQAKFRETLDQVYEMLYNHAGGREMEVGLERALGEYEGQLQNAGLYDNYTAAGLSAIRGIKDAHPLWKRLEEAGAFRQAERPEGDTTPSERVVPKLDSSHPLAAWTRKELFKPPVMTVTYSVGRRGVAGQALKAFNELIANPAKYGIDESLAKELNAAKTVLVDQLATSMMGKGKELGAIAKTLNIPDSKSLIKMMQSRGPIHAYGDGKYITMQDILSGDWRTRSDAHEVAVSVMDLAKNQFGIDDLGLGLWILKLQDSSAGRTNAGVKMMQRTIDKARKKAGEGASPAMLMNAIRDEWKPVSAFLKNVESANRTPYLLNTEVTGEYMNIAGIHREDLAPQAQRAMRGATTYDRNRPIAGRKGNIMGDTTMAARAADREAIRESGGVNISQRFLDESHSSIFGDSVGDLRTRAQNAVISDMMYEMGAFIVPPSSTRAGAEADFTPPTMNDFIRAVYDYNLSDNASFHSRYVARENAMARIKQLEAKKKEDLTPEENAELHYLHAAKKTLFRESEATPERPDQVFMENHGSSMFAGMLRAEALVDIGARGEHTPNAMGIPDLQYGSHMLHNSDMKMMRRDVEWKGVENEQALSMSDVTTAAPIDPRYIRAVRENKPRSLEPEKLPDNESLVKGFDERGQARSRESIMAENGQDGRIATEQGTTVEAVRLERLTQRLRADFLKDMAIANRHKGDAPRHAAAVEAAVQRLKVRLLQGYRNTFGHALGEQEFKANMYKLKEGRTDGVANTMFDAVANMVMDNEHVNHTGWLAGPVHEAGLFLSRFGDTVDKFEGPASVAMAPLMVFARDYDIVGTAARDFPAVTALRIADATGRTIEDIVDDMAERGFFTVHQDFVNTHYNGLKSQQDWVNFDTDARFWSGVVSDKRADFFASLGDDVRERVDIKIMGATDAWLRELGGQEGTLLKMEEVGGRIAYLGAVDHLNARPDMLRALNEALGSKFTAEEFSRALNLSRREMLESMEGGGRPLVMPRLEDGEVKEGVTDYVSGMDVIDHNITPGRLGEMPLFTENQMLHMMNLSANRQVVQNLMHSNMFGIPFDPGRELDKVMRQASSDFGDGTAMHGFASNVREASEADGLRMAHSADASPFFSIGSKIKDAYDLRSVEAGEIDLAGMAYMLNEIGLYRDGVLTQQGIDVVKDMEIGNPNLTPAEKLSRIEDIAGEINARRSDAWAEVAKAEAKSDAIKASEEYIADPLVEYGESIPPTRTPEETGPAPRDTEEDFDLGGEVRDYDAEAREAGLFDDLEAEAPEAPKAPEIPAPEKVADDLLETHRKTNPKGEAGSPPLIMTIDKTSAMDRRLGDAFVKSLKYKAEVDGDNSAANVLAVFETLTGRRGEAGADRLSSSEAMLLMEVSYMDPDLRAAFYGGHLEVSYDGKAGVDLRQTAEGRMESRLRGLSEVVKATKDKGITAGAYILTHELVERLDAFHFYRGGYSPTSNAARSRIDNLFVQNFGSAKARKVWEDALEELGVMTPSMREFLDAAGKMDIGEMKTVGDINPQLDALRARVAEDPKLREVITEGFTQVLTMALMTKNGRQVMKRLQAELGDSSSLTRLAGAIANKMHKMADYGSRYGVAPVTKGSQMEAITMQFARSDTPLDGIYNTIKNMAINTRHDKLTRSGETFEFARHWGGKGDHAPAPERTVGKVMEEIRNIDILMATASARGLDALQLRKNLLKEELAMMTEDPRHIMDPDVYEERRLAYEDENGLMDLRNVAEHERDALEARAVDEVLAKVLTQQSSMIGRAVNYVAGKFNAGAALAVNNSEFSTIRAIAALANPEFVNTRLNKNDWISDQMAIDALATDKRTLMEAMGSLQKAAKKKIKGSDDPMAADGVNHDITRFFELKNRDKAAEILLDLGLGADAIRSLEDMRFRIMDSKDGFLVRLARAMTETGQMSRTDFERFKANPQLPRGFKRDFVTKANEPEIRGLLSESIKTHLLNTKANGYRADVGEMMGLFISRHMDVEQRRAHFEAMPEDLKLFYATVAKHMPEDQRPADFHTFPDYQQAYYASNYYKKWMQTPSDMRADLKVDSRAWKAHYERLLALDSMITPKDTKNPLRLYFEMELKNQLGRDAYAPTTVLDGLAHLEMSQLKQGTRLIPSKYMGSVDAAVARNPGLNKYMDWNTQQGALRLLSSNAPRAYAASVQQHAVGLKGYSTLKIIDNIRKRAEMNALDDVPREKIDAFLQQLDTVEDQVRAGWDMRPRNHEVHGDGDRFVNSLARGSVAFMSGGNFALSAFAETFSSMWGTIGRMLRGDLLAPLDYLAAMSPGARRQALHQINGWETAKMEMGMRSRFGDMGIEALEDMIGVDTQKSFLDRFEKGSRDLQRFSMTGMKTITEYSRAVVARQAMREQVRAGRRGSYARLAQAFAELPVDADPKAVRGAARQAGIDSNLAVSLWTNGVRDPKLLRDLQEVFGDSRLFNDTGLQVQRFHERYSGRVDLRAAITHVLQFENNRINLDTRIGNKLMPKTLVQNLLSALGQYPTLFYSRMRQGAWQGGAILGSMAIVLPLLLGEIYYAVMTECAREGSLEPLEKWKRDPTGAGLSVLSKMNMLGGFTPVSSALSAYAVGAARKGMDDPSFMEGFNTQTFGMSPVNAAGAQMFISGSRKAMSAVGDFVAGEPQDGLSKVKDLLPISYKQLWKGALNAYLNEDKVGRALMQGAANPPRRSESMRAPGSLSQRSQPASGGVAPQGLRRAQAASTALSSLNRIRGISGGDLDKALD